MTGSKEIIDKIKEKVGLGSPDAGRGKSKMSKNITHGYHMVEGKSHHTMEDYVFAQFKQIDENELGLFAIFDGHLSHEIPEYLRSHLFNNILNEPNFWAEPESAIRRAYRITDTTILDKAADLGKGGSTAVTAILINGQKLVVANVGDSRAVIYKKGVAKQLSIDHEPGRERKVIEDRGGFVSNFPGDVPRVDGQLAVARAFGDKSLKMHLSSEPDVVVELIDDDTEFLILASDGVWKFKIGGCLATTTTNIPSGAPQVGSGEDKMYAEFITAFEAERLFPGTAKNITFLKKVLSNQEAADCIKDIKDARSAAKHLNEHALAKGSTDDISCVVVRFQ